MDEVPIVVDSVFMEHRLQGYGPSSGDLWALEHWQNSCDGMWNIPGSGIEPMSPALVSRFFTMNYQRSPVTCFLIF